MSEEELDAYDTRSHGWDEFELEKCAICKIAFAKTKHNKIYCSKQCRKRAEYLEKLERENWKRKTLLEKLDELEHITTTPKESSTVKMVA